MLAVLFNRSLALVEKVLNLLVTFGMIEIYENRKFSKRFTIHTKIMIYGTIILIISGMILFLSIEWNNPKTFAELSFYDKILNAFLGLSLMK